MPAPDETCVTRHGSPVVPSWHRGRGSTGVVDGPVRAAFTTLEAQEADAVASVMTAPPVGFEMLTFRLLRTFAALLPLNANRIE